MSKSLKLTCEFNVSAEEIFKAWLDSDRHSAMTGGEAICSAAEGDAFSAWDGYISGTNKTLTPHKKIVQNWRTTEFRESDPDSELTLEISEMETGCLLILTQKNIPEGQSDYEKGWIEHYFEPMKLYFEG